MRIVTKEEYADAIREARSPESASSLRGETRVSESNADFLRNDYQKDRDKILHSKAFRRLSHKTQVFLAVEGDHFRTRLTHTLEVSQIARTISRGLGLNEDLTEAIALGHDLGHTPFGHSGEDALRRALAKAMKLNSSEQELKNLYRHNEQSVRVVEVIENEGKGLNLTEEVRDGILHHTGSVPAKTMEGRIVATADRIAYVNHDIDDAIRAGLLKEEQLPWATKEYLGTTHADRIQTLVEDMVCTSAKQGDIALSSVVGGAMLELRSFLYENVYRSDSVVAEVDKASLLVELLFDYYSKHPNDIPEEYLRVSEGNTIRAVVDYIAGMTDRYAIGIFEEKFRPKPLA